MPVPSSLALTTIQTGAQILSADHRNNYAAIQTAVNVIIGFLTGASTGSTFRYNGSDWAPTTGIILDDTNRKFTLGGDTNLYRSAADVLKTDDTFVSAAPIYSQAAGAGGGFFHNPAAAGGNAFQSTVQGDANSLFYISSIGTMNWGPGGAGAVDTNLFRLQANYLKTNSTFQAALGVYSPAGVATFIKAGAPVDGDFNGNILASGLLAVDTTNSRLYVRVGATWKSVVVA